MDAMPDKMPTMPTVFLLAERRTKTMGLHCMGKKTSSLKWFENHGWTEYKRATQHTAPPRYSIWKSLPPHFHQEKKGRHSVQHCCESEKAIYVKSNKIGTFKDDCLAAIQKPPPTLRNHSSLPTLEWPKNLHQQNETRRYKNRVTAPTKVTISPPTGTS